METRHGKIGHIMSDILCLVDNSTVAFGVAFEDTIAVFVAFLADKVFRCLPFKLVCYKGRPVFLDFSTVFVGNSTYTYVSSMRYVFLNYFLHEDGHVVFKTVVTTVSFFMENFEFNGNVYFIYCSFVLHGCSHNLGLSVTGTF